MQRICQQNTQILGRLGRRVSIPARAVPAPPALTAPQACACCVDVPPQRTPLLRHPHTDPTEPLQSVPVQFHVVSDFLNLL